MFLAYKINFQNEQDGSIKNIFIHILYFKLNLYYFIFEYVVYVLNQIQFHTWNFCGFFFSARDMMSILCVLLKDRCKIWIKKFKYKVGWQICDGLFNHPYRSYFYFLLYLEYIALWVDYIKILCITLKHDMANQQFFTQKGIYDVSQLLCIERIFSVEWTHMLDRKLINFFCSPLAVCKCMDYS